MTQRSLLGILLLASMFPAQAQTPSDSSAAPLHVDPLDAGRAGALHRGPDPHARLTPQQHLKVAAEHMAAGRYPQAMAVLSQAIARYPHAPQLFNLRAALEQRQQQIRQALADMEQAVKLDPGNPLYRVTRAGLYLRFERKEAALKDLDAAVLMAPDLVPARFNRGALLAALGREREAVADFEHCTRVQPELPAPWFNLGSLHWSLGERARARKEIHRFLELAREPAWRKAGEDLLHAWDEIERKKKVGSGEGTP